MVGDLPQSSQEMVDPFVEVVQQGRPRQPCEILSAERDGFGFVDRLYNRVWG